MSSAWKTVGLKLPLSKLQLCGVSADLRSLQQTVIIHIFWLCHSKLCSFGWWMLFDTVLFTRMQNLLVSIMVSIPASHAVAWGLIPWQGVSAFRGGHCSKEVRFHCTLCKRQMEVSSSSEHLLFSLCHKQWTHFFLAKSCLLCLITGFGLILPLIKLF